MNMHQPHSVSKTLQITSCLILLALPGIKAVADEPLVFTAPPRENIQKGQNTYGPIAAFLSQVLGKKIVYKHPGNWLSYSSNMQKDKYDIIFDGPHFVSWRINKTKHTPVVKIPGGFVFKFVAYRDNNKVAKVTDLVGKRICGHAPPNQGTLRLYNQFKNPMRLPILVQVKGWRNIYSAMMKGQCEAAILPEKIFKKVDPKNENTKILYSSDPVPGQAITLGKRFSPQDIIKIRKALLSQQGQAATKNLRKRFASPTLTAANKKEYEGVSQLLAESYGFGEIKF